VGVRLVGRSEVPGALSSRVWCALTHPPPAQRSAPMLLRQERTKLEEAEQQFKQTIATMREQIDNLVKYGTKSR